jgi:hypothetical protein
MDIKLDATSKQNPSPRPKIPGKSPKSEQRPRYTYVPYRYVKEKNWNLWRELIVIKCWSIERMPKNRNNWRCAPFSWSWMWKRWLGKRQQKDSFDRNLYRPFALRYLSDWYAQPGAPGWFHSIETTIRTTAHLVRVRAEYRLVGKKVDLVV